jgi:hypothetical protein
MKTEKFEGSVSQMIDSPWLASSDIDGLGEVELEIEGVFKHIDVKMHLGKVEPVLYALKFKGKEKQMVLNNVNKRAMSNMFSADTRKWVGQKIRLFILEGIKLKGEVTRGLRIKNNAKAAAQQKSDDAAAAMAGKVNK